MLLQQRAEASKAGKPKDKKNVILFWLSGGPSHIDMWDPKPDAPSEIRGPFDSISTKVPGVRVSEHLPFTAKLMDKLTILRVDRVLHALVTDLEQRGLLDDTLVLMMDEFGRSPVMTKATGRA
jgi:hypothetical protein